MTDIKIGGLYEDKGNYRFKVLCVDGDACFIKWLDEDNNHGVLSVEAILERCKPFEPQTNADQHVQRVEYVGNDGRCRCWKCKHFEGMHETPISSDGSYYTYVVCTASKCHYEPKDEPQTDKWSHECIGCGNNDTCEFAFTDAVKICRYINEPQTERKE